MGSEEPISFDHIESFEFDQIPLIKPDPFEPNDSIADATVLGSEPVVTLINTTIHPLGEGNTDEDYFRITAHDTGMLIVNALFLHDGVDDNGTGGDLDIEIVDSGGNLIASSTSGDSNEQIIIPVVSQEVYYLHVFSNDDPNYYQLEIENFPAPVPNEIDLAAVTDTGISEIDDITLDPEGQLTIEADLTRFAALGIPILTAAQATALDTGAAVEVFVDGVSVGFAEPIGGTNNDLYSFTFAPGQLVEGVRQIKAAVVIIDGQDTPASGRTLLSEPLVLTLDTTPPPVPATFDLLTSSDTGIVGDYITKIITPAFAGTAEAGAQIRIYANGELVGSTVVASDESDGVIDGLGEWEITIEPLEDGAYDITLEVEDTAGNLTFFNPILLDEETDIIIDSTPPQRPTLDLHDEDDTGRSDLDNVTIGDPNQQQGTMDFTVTADVGTAVVIKDGNTVIDSFTSAGVDIRTLSFAEGTHLLSVESTDDARNISAQSEELVLTVDWTPPLIGSGPTLAAYSDTNILGDGLTAISAPAFLGSAEANAFIRIFANGLLVGEGFAGSDESDADPTNDLGIWEITVEPLADGVYDFWFEAEDLAGNISESEPTQVEIDTTDPQRPTIDLIEPDDTGWSQFDNITIGDPAQAGSGIMEFRVTADSGVTVLIKDGNTVIDAFVSAGSQLRTLTLSEGTHLLSVETIDESGNISAQSEELTVEVDWTAPAPSVPDMLPTSDSGASDSDNITKIIEPAFQGVAEPNTIVRVLANGTVVGEGVVGSDSSDGDPTNGLGAWEVTVEPLVEGEYIITTVIEDAAGNISEPSEGLEIEIIELQGPEDIQMPTIDLLDAHDTGFFSMDNVTSGDPNAAPGVMTFRITSDPATVVNIKDGNTIILEELPIDADGEIFVTIDFNAMTQISGFPAEGPHPLTAEAIGLVGGFKQSELLLLTVDFTPPSPTVPGLLPSSDDGVVGDNITTINEPAFSGVAEANATVRIFVDNGESGPVPVGQAVVGPDSTDGDPANGLGTWEITMEPLAGGNYTVTTQVIDLAGNVSGAGDGVPLTVNAPPLAQDDSIRIDEDTTSGNLYNQLLVNDFDPDLGDIVEIVAVNSAGTIGGVLFDPVTDTVTYTASGFDHLAVGENAQDVFMYTMQDDTGAQSVAYVLITVTGTNDAPQFISNPVTVATEDVQFSYNAVATDVDGDRLLFSLTQAPGELEIDPNTGLITGTFLNCTAGNYAVQVAVDDGNGGVATQGWTLTVLNAEPEFENAPHQLIAIEDKLFTFDFDTDDEGVGAGVTYTLSNAPAWLSVENAATGVVSGFAPDGTSGNFAVTIVAADTHGGVNDHTFILSVENAEPVFIDAPRDLTATEDQPFTFDFNTDDEADNEVSYYLIGGPSWLTVDVDTGVVSGTPLNCTAGDIVVNLLAEDNDGDSTDHLFNLHVLNVDPTFIQPRSPIPAVENELFTFDFDTDDESQGDGVVYSIVEGPEWLTIDPATGVTGGIPTDATDSPVDVVVQADDTHGGSSQLSTVVEIAASSPVFGPDVPDPDEAIFIGETFTFDFNVDDEGEGLTSYSLAVAPEWLDIDPETGVLSGTPTLAAHIADDQPITVVADDGLSEPTAFSFDLDVLGQIIVLDPNPPRQLTRATIRDADGDYVRVQMGGREGQIILTRPVAEDDEMIMADIYGVEFVGTNDRTTLGFRVWRNHFAEQGTGETNVNRMVGSSPVSLVTAFDVHVEEGILMTDDGVIGRGFFGDMAGGVVMPGEWEHGITFYALQVDSGTDMEFANTGLRKFEVRQWAGSSLTTQWANFIRSNRLGRRGVGGDLEIDLTITGENVPAGRPALRYISAENRLDGNWDINGSVHVLRAGIIEPTWNANISGDVGHIIVDEDAGGVLRAQSLLTLRVRHALENADYRVNESIRSVNAMRMRNVNLFAGVDDGVAGLPDSADQLDAGSEISSVLVRGREADVFDNTNIAASSLGRISLNGVKVDNGGTSFGLATQSIRLATWKVGDTLFRFPGDAPTNDDFEIRLL